MGISINMLDVTFSFKHDCYYCDLSREFPDATMLVCCNNQRDIIEFISDSPQTGEKAVKKLRETGTEAERSEKGNRFVVVTDRCLCSFGDDKETPLPPDMDVLMVSPRIFNNGWEQRRMLGFNNGHVRAIMKTLQERFPTKILSKRPVSGGLFGELVSPSSNQLFGHMTQKQIDALTLACKEGYYISPRKVTTEQLAKRSGTTRATYEEHLRKAENKVIKVLFDYMAAGPGGRALASGHKARSGVS